MNSSDSCDQLPPSEVRIKLKTRLHWSFPSPFKAAMCNDNDESQTGSSGTVIKQSCINTTFFLCASLAIVWGSRRPVFIQKSPNKISSHLDRKCRLLLPGTQMCY